MEACDDVREIYLKDRFNREYLILRFGCPSHFAGTNNCRFAKKSTTPTDYIFLSNSITISKRHSITTNVHIYADALIYIAKRLV